MKTLFSLMVAALPGLLVAMPSAGAEPRSAAELVQRRKSFFDRERKGEKSKAAADYARARELGYKPLSAYRISKNTGLMVTSVIRFAEAATSLRLDKAEMLAGYFRLELKPRNETSNDSEIEPDDFAASLCMWHRRV